jgi:hypothetical protein
MIEFNGIFRACNLELVAFFGPAIALRARPPKRLAASGVLGAVAVWWRHAPVSGRFMLSDHDCSLRYTCRQPQRI